MSAPSPARLHISRATAADIPALATLVNRAYRGEASSHGWTTEAHLLDGLRTDADDLAELLAGPEATILLARTAAGALVGSVYLKRQGADLYLGMLSVEPTQQAQGTGRQLMQAAAAYAHQLGCTGLLISVISVRHELIAWYERQGFRATGETAPFPSEATRLSTPRQALQMQFMRKPL